MYYCDRYFHKYKVKSIAAVVCLFIFSNCEDQLFADRSSDPRYVFDIFWQEVDRNYSFFEQVSVDWDSVHAVYKPKIKSTTSNTELFKILDETLTLLDDAHANVYAPMGTAGNNDYFSQYPVNPIVAEPTSSYFDFYTQVNRALAFGKLKNSNLAYIRIRTFEGDESDFDEIDLILKELAWSTGLIIDVRTNMGGQIDNSELVAARFAQSTMLAYEYRLRNGGQHSDFTSWYKVNLNPHSQTMWNEKPIAILTNRGSFSATEWFVLFMKLLPNVTLVGDATGGGGAVPITRELPNGWILRIPNTQTRLPSGNTFQGVGIHPDLLVWISKEDELNNIDTILAAAIGIF